MKDAIRRILTLDKHHHPIDRLAKVNALISGVTLYPQVFKIVATGNVEGFSLTTYILIAFNSLLWIIFAVHRKLLPLLISSVLNCLAACIIAMVILFR